MGYSRYDNRSIFENREELYENLFEDKGVKKIVQYDTSLFKKITPEQYSQLSVITKKWSTGDRYYKLAAEHYGDPKLWWIIARFNNKPTEGHLKLGDNVLIPLPREVILGYYKD